MANESTTSPWRRFRGAPVASSCPEASATPTNVDSESNRSVSITVIIAGTSASCSAPQASSCRKTDEKSGALNQAAGGATQPPSHAAAVTKPMPAR